MFIEFLKQRLKENLEQQLKSDLNYYIQQNEAGGWCYLRVEDYKYLIELIEKDSYKGEYEEGGEENDSNTF